MTKNGTRMPWHICQIRILDGTTERQVSAKWWGREFSYLNQTVLEGSEQGEMSAIGSSPRPTIPSEQNWMLTSTSPVAWVSKQLGCHHGCPHDLMGVYGLFGQNAGNDWHWTALHGVFPLQGLWDFHNPGGGHRGWELVVDWCSMNSHGGVVSTSAFVEAHIAVAAGQPSLWGCQTGIPSGGPCSFMCSFLGTLGEMAPINCGELISIHLAGTVAKKTSRSVKVMSSSIAPWSFCTLLARWWGWPGNEGFTSSAQCCRALA